MQAVKASFPKTTPTFLTLVWGSEDMMFVVQCRRDFLFASSFCLDDLVVINAVGLREKPKDSICQFVKCIRTLFNPSDKWRCAHDVIRKLLEVW